MFKAIFDLMFAISRLVLITVFGYKFLTSDINENKTLYYGIWVLMCMISTGGH